MAAPVWKIDNTNLVYNPEFDLDTDGWEYGGTASQTTFAVQTGSPRVGLYSLRVTASATGSQYAAPRTTAAGDVPVTPGQSYTFTATIDLLSSSPASSYANVQISWYDSAYVSKGTSTSVNSATGSGIKTLTVSDTAPSGATIARLFLVHHSGGTSGTLDAYWDSVSFTTAVGLTSTPFFLTGQQLPLPDLEPQYASGVTTEGDRLQTQRYRNRKITLNVRVIGASTAGLQDSLNTLQQRVAKINRDAVMSGTGYGGTLDYTTVNGTTVVFDVVSATMSTELGRAYVIRNSTEVTLEFECAPFARGTEVMLSDHTGAEPLLTFTETYIGGDVPALGRLVVDNDTSVDSASFIWGLRSYNYSAAATAALVWQAEALTPMNAGAAVADGPASYSGASSNNTIKVTSLTTEWQPILKSTVSSTYWTHNGAYRVYARVYRTANSTLSLRASWALADVVNFTTNAPKDVPSGDWALMDLGVVRIPRGNARWELRLESKNVGDAEYLYVDSLLLIPVDEGFGVASIASATPARTLSAQDTFDQSSLVSGTTTLSPLGGTWTTAGGDSTDYAMDTSNKRLQRTHTADTATSSTIKDGRFIVESGSSAYAGQRAQVTTYRSNPSVAHLGGVLLRYTNASNFCAAVLHHGYAGSTSAVLEVFIVVAGTVTKLIGESTGFPNVAGEARTIVAEVSKNGNITVTASAGGTYVATATASSSYLATGNTLATGKYGIVDWQPSGTANTRTYDDFYGWQIASDAAVFGTRSLTLDHKSITRQYSSSTVSTRPASYSGDYLLVPVSSRESRAVQFAVRLSRTLVDNLGDYGGTDSLSARLWVTPRYLQLPS